MCSDLMLPPLPPYPLGPLNNPRLLSGVSMHGQKVNCQIMWNTATQYDAVFNFLTSIYCRASTGFSEMNSIM